MRASRFPLLFLILPWVAFGRMVHDGRIVSRLPLGPEERAALSKSSAGSPVHHWPHPTGHRELAALLVDFSDAPADFADFDEALAYTRQSLKEWGALSEDQILHIARHGFGGVFHR